MVLQGGGERRGEEAEEAVTAGAGAGARVGAAGVERKAKAAVGSECVGKGVGEWLARQGMHPPSPQPPSPTPPP